MAAYFPKGAVERCDGVGGVDDFADLIGEGEKRNDLSPCPPPTLADSGVTLAPFASFKGRERLFGVARHSG